MGDHRPRNVSSAQYKRVVLWISFFFLCKTLNSCPRKTHGKKGMEKIWKSCDGRPSSPKSNEVTKPLGSYQYPLPHFFLGLWEACSSHVFPVTDGRYDNCTEQRSQAASSTSWSHLARSTAHCRLDWAHAELKAMIISCVTTCERGVVKASDDSWCTSHVLALFRVGILGKNVFFSFSDHFCLIFSWKGRYRRPTSFFVK